MVRALALALVLLACREPAKTPPPTAEPALGSAAPAGPGSAAEASGAAQQLAGWDLPTGWRSEVIPFPLDFAPSIAHRGFEELRFPPGFFEPTSGEYWAYAFVWRTDDAAELDGPALAAELTAYFQGLIAAVDQKGRITERDKIVAHAKPEGDRFVLHAHVFDAFKTAQPIDLVGWATRRACARGALWTFVLAPETTTIRDQLDAIGRDAGC